MCMAQGGAKYDQMKTDDEANNRMQTDNAWRNEFQLC